MCFTNKHIVLFMLLLFFSTNIVSALDASPYAGKVVINEILYKQTCGGLANATINDEFIELYFNDSVNISGWTIADGNVVDDDTDGTGGFSFTFPQNSIFNAGDYVVIWIGNSNDPYNLKNAINAKAQFYVGKGVKLNDNGDDIWLFDSENKIVDYVAYGSDAAINNQSALPANFWQNNVNANPNSGQSIALTPNGIDNNNGDDWEASTSDTAAGPITIDSDDGSCNGNERISSAGINNNAEKVEIKGYVYEDFYPLGINNGEDTGIENVHVYLFKDDGDGALDSGDSQIDSTTTDSNGYYNFSRYFDGVYFVVIDSKTVGTTKSLNSGYDQNDIWAEQTYQAEYKGSWSIVKKFGGQDVNVSDDFSNGVYEHWTKIDISNYNGESIDFGFSFNVVVNVKDAFAQGTLRQFLENARAISGSDRSYFIFNMQSNKIVVNASLSYHPAYVVDDSTHLNGTILDWNLKPRGTIAIEGIGNLTDCFIFLAKGDNVTMENIKIIGNIDTANNGGIRGIRLSGITNSLFKNLEICKCHVGIELYWNAKYNTIEAIEAHDNDYGIYFYWTSGSHNEYNTVKNCKAYNNKYTGIGLYYDSDHNVIDSNEVYNNGWAGIWIGYFCDYNEIKNNHAYNNSVSGILISANQGNAAKHNTIEDNIVENNGGFWDATVNYDSGIGLCYANDNTIRNNVIKNNYDTSGPVYGIALDGGSSGNLIENNEIFGNGVGINVVNSNSKNNTFSKNSIYNNYGLGIDLGNDGVTPNDGVLNSDKANYGVDYPLITTAKLIGNQLYVKGFINDESANNGSSGFANAIVEIFLVKNSINGDNLVGNNYNGKNYGEGWIYLGSLIADSNGNFNGYIDVSGKGIDSQSLISATTTLNGKGTSEFGTTIKTQVKVDVVKIDNPDPVKINDVLRYTINVSNRGNTQLNVVIKDFLDKNTTYISSSHSGAYHASNHTVIWFLNLNPLESKIIKLNVSIKDVPNGTILRNHVAIYSDGDILNDAWQNTTVLGADFSIEKSDSLDPVAPNANLSYTINVTNTGYVNASVVVKDVLDPNVTHISSNPPGSYYSSNNTVVWSIQLNVSESKIITLNVKVKDVANGTVLSDYVNVSLNGIKYAEDTEQTTVNEPKIAITKIDNPDPVYVGKLLNYTIVIENIGSTKAENVFVKDELDNNVTYISSSPAGIYYSSNHTLIWNINSLNISESKMLNISVLVKNTVPNGTIINNSAIASLPGFYNETNQSTTVLAAEIYDPKTAIDLNGPPLQPGDVLEYSIWLNDTGVVDTTAFFVDRVPEHTTYANYVWASSGNVSYNAPNNSIEWYGNIPAGSYVNVRFRVKIDAPLPDNTIISNQGTVYYDSNNDNIIDAEKPTDDPTTNQPYDPTNVTVKNPKITLTKTATTADYGKNVTFTIKLCVEGYATNVTLVEHYPSKLRFIEANPKPTEGNNIWKFKKLQDECVEIKITMYIPAYYYEYESKSEVRGKGIILNNKKFYTGIKPTTIVNRVSLTCDQGIKKEAAVKVTIREKRGNFAAIHERGIGNYSSEESIKVKRRIIYVKKSVNANSTDSNFSINYCFQNKYGDYIKKRLYGKSMGDFTKAKSSTPRMESETTINGTYTVKIKSDFRMNETYNGNYNIQEKIDGNADVNVKGRGLGIFEEESAYHRMFERGMGNYESKTKFNELSFEKKTNATNFLQKVCYFNNSNYISTTTEGNFSNNVKAYSLLNYSLNSQLNGSLKFKMDALAKVDEWYVGKFTVNKEISMAYLTPWIPDGIISKGEYENKTAFDGFEIYWKSDEKYLYMALKANTTGWLRIGFAICSCFNPAYDYIAGFVVNNKTKVLDMYYNETLMLDKNVCGDFGCCKQSISKFGGKERGNCTTIEFKRKLDTKDACDAKLVKGKKVKIVWAVGKDDDVWSEDVRSGEGEIVI